ncbi:MAG: hypothetical protein RR249_00390, partial [Tannerellaceae bacterium]
KRAPISHVSHELTERQIDGGVKRGILILKSVLNKLTIVAELFCMDQEKLLSLILLDNRRLRVMRGLAQTA